MKFFLVLACIAVASADVSHIVHNYLPPTTAKPVVQLAAKATPAPLAPLPAVGPATQILPSISTYSTYGHLPAFAPLSATPAPAVSTYASLPAVGPTYAPLISTATAAPVHAPVHHAAVHTPVQHAAVHAPVQHAAVHAPVQHAAVHAPVQHAAPVHALQATPSYVSAPRLSSPLAYSQYSYPSTYTSYPSTYATYPSSYATYPSAYTSYPSTLGYPSTLTSYPSYPATSGLLGSHYQYPSAPLYTHPVSTLPEYSSLYSGYESVYGGLTPSTLYAPSHTEATVVDAKVSAPLAPLAPVAPAKPIVALPVNTPAPATTPAPILEALERVEAVPSASFNHVDGYVYKSPEH